MFVSREELSKNINADEAAAMGAVYQAAALSKAFKVKPFLVRDAAVFPIQVRERDDDINQICSTIAQTHLRNCLNGSQCLSQVEFSREAEEDDGVRTTKHNKRILFQRMAPYPQRKVITFNRYTDDFVFYVNYGDLSFLSEEDMKLVDRSLLY